LIGKQLLLHTKQRDQPNYELSLIKIGKTGNEVLSAVGTVMQETSDRGAIARFVVEIFLSVNSYNCCIQNGRICV
jgi:hypothetical protein